MDNGRTVQAISDELISLLVKKAFSCTPAAIEQVELAHTNSVYVITLSTGKKTVLKIGPYDDVKLMHHEKNMMYTEVTVMQKMRNYTSIEVPDMYYYDSSHTEIPASYFFMEYMDGDNYRDIRDALSRQAQAAIDEELGRHNRIINNIIGSAFGYYGRRKRQRDNWFEAFQDMLKDILDDAKYYNVQLPYDEDVILQLFMQDKEIFNELKEPHLVHCDLWDGNVFIKNGRVQGIIDWERCLWGDPLMELAFKPSAHREAFYRGYGQHQLSETEIKRVKWYNLYTALAYLTEYYSRRTEDDRVFIKIWHWITDSIDSLNV